MSKDKRNTAKLDKVLANLEKSFGTKIVQTATDALKAKDAVPSGYEELDNIIGCGGFPLGIIAEFYGPEASGKGVVCMSIIKMAQKEGRRCLWVDAEHQCNPSWMEINGISLSDLDIVDANRSAEEILEIVEQLVSSGSYSIVVIDSLAALVPQIELDKKVGETQVGRMGAIMSTALRKLSGVAESAGCSVIFINQTREKIGVMFGNPETTPGGKALGFFASLRLRIQKLSEKIKKNGEEVGVMSKVKVIKNRFGPPHKEAMLPIYYVVFNPSPMEKFMDYARDLKAVRISKGNYIFNKMVCDDLYGLADILYTNDAFLDLAKKIELLEKEKKSSIEDEDVRIVIGEILNGTFDYVKYANMNSEVTEEVE